MTMWDAMFREMHFMLTMETTMMEMAVPELMGIELGRKAWLCFKVRKQIFQTGSIIMKTVLLMNPESAIPYQNSYLIIMTLQYKGILQWRMIIIIICGEYGAITLPLLMVELDITPVRHVIICSLIFLISNMDGVLVERVRVLLPVPCRGAK